MAERRIRGLELTADRGINLVEDNLQAANGDHPNLQAGKNTFGQPDELKPDFTDRLKCLVREADRRGMVVLIGTLSPLEDQELMDEAASRRAREDTARVLESSGLRNIFVDLMYEFDHPRRIDHAIYRESDGAAKMARVAGWFHAHAPEIEVGITPTRPSRAPRVTAPACRSA